MFGFGFPVRTEQAVPGSTFPGKEGAGQGFTLN